MAAATEEEAPEEATDAVATVDESAPMDEQDSAAVPDAVDVVEAGAGEAGAEILDPSHVDGRTERDGRARDGGW